MILPIQPQECEESPTNVVQFLSFVDTRQLYVGNFRVRPG